MIFEIVLFILIGIACGTVTGLTPGIHINLISALVMAYSLKLTSLFDPLFIATGLISMAITHTFLDILPTTFLGAADADNAASTLPSHKLLFEGRAKESISLALIGGFFGLILIVLLTPIIIIIIPKAYEIIQNYIPVILIYISLSMIYKSKNKKIALTIFALSGALGILTFSLKTLNQPLLPLLSGLFGVSALVLSIKNKIKIPIQKENIKLNLNKIDLVKNLLAGIIASLLTSFLPGLTSSHTTAIASTIKKTDGNKDYILINNSISTVSMYLSIIALYSIEKARNGVIVTLSNIIEITRIHLFFFAAVSFVAAFISILMTLKLTNIFSRIAPKINYQILSLLIICFILILTSFLSGPLGLLVLIASTSLGIFSLLIETERTHLMGVLILPVIFYLLM